MVDMLMIYFYDHACMRLTVTVECCCVFIAMIPKVSIIDYISNVNNLLSLKILVWTKTVNSCDYFVVQVS